MNGNNFRQDRPTGKTTAEPRRVLITGCSSGFGRHLVDRFLGDGWLVIATMRNAESRKSLFSDQLNQFGKRLIVANLDVTSPIDRNAIAELVSSQDNPGLDCLINNAGYALFGALESCSEEQIKQQYDVNLMAPMLLTRKLLPMLRERQGAVINISSLMGFMGFPLSSIYCSSKAGLSMASESLSYELAPLGVRVHTVEPGGFRTGFLNNSDWGKCASPPYGEATDGFQNFQRRIGAGKGRAPSPVVDRIVTLANGNSKAISHQVGQDAVVSKIVQKSLPESFRIRMMATVFKRILR